MDRCRDCPWSGASPCPVTACAGVGRKDDEAISDELAISKALGIVNQLQLVPWVDHPSARSSPSSAELRDELRRLRAYLGIAQQQIAALVAIVDAAGPGEVVDLTTPESHGRRRR